jgi:HEAT repeat protein
LTNKTVEPNPSTVDSVLEQSRQSRDPHTKSTSENAIYEVLGQLHAAEAVPLLVTIMEEEEVHDMIQGMSPVMRGLAEIGPAAVPRLVESIDTAASKAKALLSSGLSEERRQSDLIQEGRIELRATLVLRAIGDPRAIPALERLQQATNNWFIAREAREAVESIQNRTLR